MMKNSKTKRKTGSYLAIGIVVGLPLLVLLAAVFFMPPYSLKRSLRWNKDIYDHYAKEALEGRIPERTDSRRGGLSIELLPANADIAFASCYDGCVFIQEVCPPPHNSYGIVFSTLPPDDIMKMKPPADRRFYEVKHLVGAWYSYTADD